MKFQLVKSGKWFIPAYEEDAELVKKISQGSIITGQTERPRNYEFHKKAFACLNLGFENQEKDEIFELYRAKILIKAGHCYVIILENGQANFIPKSISYEAIPDDHEFSIIYNKIVEVVANELMISNEDLAMQVASQF